MVGHADDAALITVAAANVPCPRGRVETVRFGTDSRSKHVPSFSWCVTCLVWLSLPRSARCSSLT